MKNVVRGPWLTFFVCDQSFPHLPSFLPLAYFFVLLHTNRFMSLYFLGLLFTHSCSFFLLLVFLSHIHEHTDYRCKSPTRVAKQGKKHKHNNSADSTSLV
jgi:hypothetical protein